MSKEEFPTGPESVDRSTLIDVLKTKGVEDPESKELMIVWCERREAEVSAEGTREAQVNFEIERAQIYQDVGNLEYAVEALEGALQIAMHEGLEDVARAIEAQLSLLQ